MADVLPKASAALGAAAYCLVVLSSKAASLEIAILAGAASIIALCGPLAILWLSPPGNMPKTGEIP
jgi:hypothetical protein